MKLLGWNVGWSRNIAIGLVWTAPDEVEPDFRNFAFFFFGLTIYRKFPVKRK